MWECLCRWVCLYTIVFDTHFIKIKNRRNIINCKRVDSQVRPFGTLLLCKERNERVIIIGIRRRAGSCAPRDEKSMRASLEQRVRPPARGKGRGTPGPGRGFWMTGRFIVGILALATERNACSHCPASAYSISHVGASTRDDKVRQFNVQNTVKIMGYLESNGVGWN